MTEDSPRTPGAWSSLQRIEPLDVVPEPVPVPMPLPPPIRVVASPSPPTAPEPQERLVCRFPSAAAALSYAGNLLAVGGCDDVSVLHDPGPSAAWWISALVELTLGRQLAGAARGDVFLQLGGQLVADYGWGPAPDPADGDRELIDLSMLAAAEMMTLIRAAGLHRAWTAPTDEVRVLLPGWRMPSLVRRALELDLHVSHRPVELRPLFALPPAEAAAAGAGRTVLMELRLSGPVGGLPPALLGAISRDPHVCVTRYAGDGLMIQRGLASPLADHLLVGMVDSGTWVLAAPPFGCWRLEPLGELVDSWSLIRPGVGYALTTVAPPPADATPRLPDLEVVPRRTPGRLIDATLLNQQDLDTVRLMLEGTALAETALLVRGRGRHLLFAPGGLLERLPAGEPLYCLGPGPLYLPLGYVLRPRIPATGRRALFAADERSAVVLLSDQAIVFDLGRREPVWSLWAGELPEVEVNYPDERWEELEAIGRLDKPAVTTVVTSGPVPVPAPRERPARRGLWTLLRRGSSVQPTWEEVALALELRGELVQAAELHRRNGSMLRAGHLFERASTLADG